MYVTHKFRSAIGKTKLVRDGELILTSFSGGPSSSAMLHLIQEVTLKKNHVNHFHLHDNMLYTAIVGKASQIYYAPQRGGSI